MSSILDKLHYIKIYLNDVVTDDFLDWLVDIHYFEAPASSIQERSYKGSLYDHSINVYRILSEFTDQLGLKWSRKESPMIIGLFHDVIKADTYSYNLMIRNSNNTCELRKYDRLIVTPTDTFKYNDDPDLHGFNSYLLLNDRIKLTDEEKYCIEFHQGAFTDKSRWNQYNDAIRKYPNVLFTHTADMIASQLIELGYDFQIHHKKGKWKLNKDGSGTCSECHFTQNEVWDLDNWQNYCGHCGADMR